MAVEVIKMTWEEKIKKGMQMIAEGCKANDGWDKCRKCPFDDYCTSILNDIHDSEPKSDIWSIDEIEDFN